MRRESRAAVSRARSKRTGKNPSVLEVAFERVGFRKAGRVVAFVSAWAIAEADIGREITCDEYCAWWRMARSTAFREQASFRECFHEFETPTALIAACRASKVEASMAGLRHVAWSW